MLARISPELILYHQTWSSVYPKTLASTIFHSGCDTAGDNASDGGLFETLRGYSDDDDAPDRRRTPTISAY